jgi:MoaA/NifB/PqqE/SkfB family radical SAM enzyme
MPTEWLVTAPYILEVVRDGVAYFHRLDLTGTKRSLVRATPLVRALLERFASPVALSAFSDVDTMQVSIQALFKARLLVDADALGVPVPSIELELTNRCDARCVMCPREDLRPLGTMSESTFLEVLSIIRETPVTGVILQGIGEPTLHPALSSWTRRLRSALGETRPLTMVTNGFRMAPDVLGGLRDAGVDHVEWSFHSLDAERYDRIMGVPSYSRARQNFEACAHLYPDMISVNFVVMEENAHEQAEIEAWLIALGLPASRLRRIPCFSRAGFVDLRALSCGPRRRSSGRCLYVRKSLFFAWNGDVLPCSNDIAGVEVYARIAECKGAELLRRWCDNLLSRPMRLGICQNCDHFLRATLETDWFDLIHSKDIGDIVQRDLAP